ncbi:hypothetical protein BU23DRAFT_595047 [Bimuria novae-zelandiae CBS 107.79]|uniref:Uncharacterized protein n=1 Tax=Bimuria novae-zelandiae CBS 107.79 TaxID=1447943 RepID=A0A6A5VTM0_9PLEO|nr:hypothetical protein BU23DRAFT_595047 [Bimuria novae-zelandiae CBS 107.79]
MPPSTTSPSSDRDTIQKYMALSSQKEVIGRRLSLGAPIATSTPEHRSPAPSPQTSFSSSSNWSAEPEYTSNPIPVQQSAAGHRHSISDLEDAHKLFEINKEIKATLTELLNTESVRSDSQYRQWIQGRLMDAEQQIRRQRRRRSSGSTVDREFASSIAEHLDMGIGMSKTWT